MNASSILFFAGIGLLGLGVLSAGTLFLRAAFGFDGGKSSETLWQLFIWTTLPGIGLLWLLR